MALSDAFRQKQKDLMREIRLLSNEIPIDEIELIRKGNGIIANAHRIFWLDEPRLMPIAFNRQVTLPKQFGTPPELPVKRVREFWQRSCDLIPRLTLRRGVPAGGFLEWLWSFTQHFQRKSTGIVEMAYAIDPYAIWIGTIIGKAEVPNLLHLEKGNATSTVPADPCLATADQIQTVALVANCLIGSPELFRKLEAASEAVRTATQQPKSWLSDGALAFERSKFREAWYEARRVIVWDSLVRSYSLQLLPMEFVADLPELGSELYIEKMRLAATQLSKAAVAKRSEQVLYREPKRTRSAKVQTKREGVKTQRGLDPRHDEIVRAWKSGTYRTIADMVEAIHLKKLGNITPYRRAQKAIDRNRKQQRRRK